MTRYLKHRDPFPQGQENNGKGFTETVTIAFMEPKSLEDTFGLALDLRITVFQPTILLPNTASMDMQSIVQENESKRKVTLTVPLTHPVFRKDCKLPKLELAICPKARMNGVASIRGTIS